MSKGEGRCRTMLPIGLQNTTEGRGERVRTWYLRITLPRGCTEGARAIERAGKVVGSGIDIGSVIS